MKELSIEKCEFIDGGKKISFGCGMSLVGYSASLGLMVAFPPAGIGALLVSGLVVTAIGMTSVGYSCDPRNK